MTPASVPPSVARMTMFLGADTDQLESFAAQLLADAAQADALGEAAERAKGVEWEGPDADDFRSRLSEVAQRSGQCAEQCRARAQELRRQAAQQDEASAADGAGWFRGTGGPGTGGPGSGWSGTGTAGRGEHPAPPGLQPPPFGSPQSPYIGIPVHPLPLPAPLPALPPDLASRPYFGPMISPDPTHSPFPWPQPGAAAPEHAPAEHLETARTLRHAALSPVPLVSLLQDGVDAHARSGEMIDDAEGWAQERGLGDAAAPLAGTARMLHGAGGFAFGTHSVGATVLEQTDALIASRLTTAEDLLDAAVAGDGAAGIRALEDGAARDSAAVVRGLTATAAPALTDSLARVSEGAADAVRPFAPSEVTDALDRSSEELDRATETWEEAHRAVTDAEGLLEVRREHVPMPWDAPRG